MGLYVKVTRRRTAREFLESAGPWLGNSEAENNLILGIASGLNLRPERYRGETYFITLEENDLLAGAAFISPPHHLMITRSPEAALKTLAGWLLSERIAVSGVLGPNVEAKVFADEWVSKTGKSLRPGLGQRIYACFRVVQPAYSPGRLRRARKDDEPLLLQWCREFIVETGVPETADPCNGLIHNELADGFLYIWEDGQPVSMAGLTGESAHGIRVSLVYTPPILRKKGYATSCVAALTQRILDSGKRFCCLYTDLGNPTSNNIYQKIGYELACDCQDWFFD